MRHQTDTVGILPGGLLVTRGSMVEITLSFTNESEFEHELRCVFEAIALADEDELKNGDYADIMKDTAEQAQLAYNKQILGHFLEGKHIYDTNTTTKQHIEEK